MSPARFPVFDAHVDSMQLALDLGRDLSRAGPGHLDLARGREGGLEQVVFVCWTDPAYLERGPGAARARARALLGAFHELCARSPENVGFAGNGSDLEALRTSDRVAAIAGIEGAHVLEDLESDLAWFFDRGVRVLTLCWNNHLRWIRSCHGGAGPEIPEGLSHEGRGVVARLNELGVVIDLSHAGQRSFYDVLEVSRLPVIASHSGCKALCDHPRNLTDDQLRAVREHGGVVGIAFCTPFLSHAESAEEKRLRKTDAYKALHGVNDTELHLAQGEFLQTHASPFELDRVVEHIEHVVEVAGIDHVGLGSDFDGIQRRPAGLESARDYGNLAARLLSRGFRPEDVEKVFGANMWRVFAAVTGRGTAACDAELVGMSAETQPSSTASRSREV